MKTASIKTMPPEIVKEGVKRWILIVGEKMMLAIYELSEGVTFPLHSHPHEQVGYIVSGRIEHRTPTGSEILEAGTGYIFPSNEPHETHNPGPGPVIVVDVFSPPREDYLKSK